MWYLILVSLIVTDILIMLAESFSDVLLLSVSLTVNVCAAIHLMNEEGQ